MEEKLYAGKGVIRTFTGKYLNVLDPMIDDIDIVDIAHALSHTPRFGGHTRYFYSVAQHSVNVALNVFSRINNCRYSDFDSTFKFDLLKASKLQRAIVLKALLHDASEAYIGDIPSPIKSELTNYHMVEATLMGVIENKFLPPVYFAEPTGTWTQIKEADKEELEAEWNIFIQSNNSEIPKKHYEILSKKKAKHQFLKMFYFITSIDKAI